GFPANTVTTVAPGWIARSRAHPSTASSRCGETTTMRSSSPGNGSPHSRMLIGRLRLRLLCSLVDSGSASHPVGYACVSFATQAVSEEAALRPRVRVIVVRNVAHVVVDIVLELEEALHDRRQLLVHVRELRRWRGGAMASPHDHRNRADLALRDPTHVVLVEPRRDACRFAQIAPVSPLERFRHGEDDRASARLRLVPQGARTSNP